MSNIELNSLCTFIITLCITFLFNKILYSRKKFKKNPMLLNDIKVLVNRFNLDLKKVKYKKVVNRVSFANSFIISFVFIIVINIKNRIISLLIGFVLLGLLYYSIYEIMGRYFVKKGMCKNV